MFATENVHGLQRNQTKLLSEADTRSPINKIRKLQTSFFGRVMGGEKLEDLVTTGMIERKRSRGNQRKKILFGLAKWLKVGQVTDALKSDEG